jgi:hypothetical protein
LDAFLSSSEEMMFGMFMEDLAVFLSGQVDGGWKSSTDGVDLEFNRDGVRYLVAVKSGPHWANNQQLNRLTDNFRRAIKVLSPNKDIKHIQPVLGQCYGRAPTVNAGVYVRYTGQAFWHFLSGERELYIELIEPIGRQAKAENDEISRKRAALANRLEAEFISEFCTDEYSIDWKKLVVFNSGNMQDDTPAQPGL